MAERDYYKVLGVPRDADRKAIKDAYHRLAMQWHPDRNSSPEAEGRFKEIAKAYAVLSDPKKRASYDAHGFEGVAHFSPDELYRGVDLGSLFGDLGFGFGPGGQSIFDRFFGGPRAPGRGADLQVRLDVPLERIATGGKETVHVSRPVACGKCHGHGTRSGQPPPVCEACGGTGHKVVTRQADGKDHREIHFQQILRCTKCDGAGTIIDKSCTKCGGTGQVEKVETLKVKIPAGIEDGMVLRVAGHGLPGAAGEAPGDLHVAVFTSPDARFQRRDADLWRGITIDVADAVLGTQVQVPTLSGEVEVKVPAGTQPNEVLRLRGQGLPRLGTADRGDLKLRVQVHVPTEPSADERNLYERLQGLRRRT
ncbi:MAG: J domain-containing protein [Chromatiales bacterium]|nr:MAG: J domain-containing protein [Chromatiales bacterium]